MEPERNGPKRKAEASASPLQPLGVQGVINSGREACAAGGAQGGDKQRPPAKERAPRTKTPKQLVTLNPNPNPNPNLSPNPNPNPNPNPISDQAAKAEKEAARAAKEAERKREREEKEAERSETNPNPNPNLNQGGAERDQP